MRAVQVTQLGGPEALEINDVAEPTGELLVDVHAIGVSFPDLLLSKGEYQVKPDLPFNLGVDFAGTVRAAPHTSGFTVGQRVAGVNVYGAAAEVITATEENLFPLPEALSFEQGAALPMNYLTAQFALADRAGLREGETVLVNGAAGGVGTAAIQVAKGYGARTIGVASTPEKAEFAKAAGADDVVLVEGFKDAARELTGGHGVNIVIDVVGGDLMTDSLRSLAPNGRVMVVGFAGGLIPQVKVNRLLLGNTDVRGVGWGSYAKARPGFMRRQWEHLLPMMESGVVDPPIGRIYPLAEMGQALVDMEERRTLGKSVVLF